MTSPHPNRIRELREALNREYPGDFTQAALARRLMVDADTLRSWESGVRRPQGRNERRLARALYVRAGELWLPPGEGPGETADAGVPPGEGAPD